MLKAGGAKFGEKKEKRENERVENKPPVQPEMGNLDANYANFR
jgi:hypothetical protein